jgi:hypothetical protein
MAAPRESHGYQIPEKSGWTMFVGPLPLAPGEQTQADYLYLVRPDVLGVLPLAMFSDHRKADIAVVFLDAMMDQVNRAILHHQTAVDRERGGAGADPNG